MPILMGFISSLKRSPDRASRARRAAAPLDSASAEALRARVRRRFIGAAVLVIAAVLVLPLVFESEPRPVPSSVRVTLPDRDPSALSATPDVRPDATTPLSALPVPAAGSAAGPAASGLTRAVAAPASAPLMASAPRPAPRVEPVAVRYVIQVGAFAEASAVREMRQRIDKLGLRSTQQDVEVQGGRRTRVRLGPFATREEADRTAARLRAAGLNATLLQI